MNNQLRDNTKRVQIAIIFLGVYLLINFCHIISRCFEYDLLFKVKNYGYIITGDKASSNDLRQRILNIISFVSYIVTAVAFLFWFRRAYYNLETQLEFTNYTNGQAVYYWFIPIITWYKPYRITKDLFSETDMILEERIENYQPKTSISLLTLWWTFWIVNCIYSYIIFRLPFENIDGFMTRDICIIISRILSIVAGIFLLMVIRKYHSMELQLQESIVFTEEKPTKNIDTYTES